MSDTKDNNLENNVAVSEEALKELKEQLQTLRNKFKAMADQSNEQSTQEKCTTTATATNSKKDNEDEGAPIMRVSEIMPEQVIVIPCFVKPIMPTQISSIQLQNDYEDAIIQIAKSEDRCFAIF